jgi:hypothetical protein
MGWNDKLDAVHPMPSGGGCGDFHDLAAVVAGTKPAAWVDHSFLSHPVGKELVKRATAKGLKVATVKRLDGHDSAVIGQPDNVAAVIEGNRNELNHRQIGRALGYPEEAVGGFKTPVTSATRSVTKYRQSPAISEFISAVRNIRSSNQELRRSIPAAQYKKMGIDVDSIVDAIADSPKTASANTAHVITHDGDMDKLRAAVALIGLQLQSPSYLLFHPNEEGQDKLYKMTVAGSAEKLRRKLDAAGLVNRTLMPNDTGWSVTLFDSGGGMEGVVNSFAQQEGVPLQSSSGHGEMIGSGDEAEANKDDRRTYRSILRKWERSQQTNADLSTSTGQHNPSTNQPAGNPTAVDQPTNSGPTAGAIPTAAGPATTGGWVR